MPVTDRIHSSARGSESDSGSLVQANGRSLATRFSHRLPIYASLVPDPSSWAVDALSNKWEGLDAYAFPPSPILGKKGKDRRSAIYSGGFDVASPTVVPDLRLLYTSSGGTYDVLQPRSGVPHCNLNLLKFHDRLLCVLHLSQEPQFRSWTWSLKRFA